ncbi:hypothetical protein [uncultured Roseibium sp.]|uniref:hypothetical protein n=1 Tax=uncultured Roseibium sp. TaxID=1936171 RepID=UPI00262CAFA9|nr:hypothetical protein [uncultured Roseibium sp.]
MFKVLFVVFMTVTLQAALAQETHTLRDVDDCTAIAEQYVDKPSNESKRDLFECITNGPNAKWAHFPVGVEDNSGSASETELMAKDNSSRSQESTENETVHVKTNDAPKKAEVQYILSCYDAVNDRNLDVLTKDWVTFAPSLVEGNTLPGVPSSPAD